MGNLRNRVDVMLTDSELAALTQIRDDRHVALEKQYGETVGRFTLGGQIRDLVWRAIDGDLRDYKDAARRVRRRNRVSVFLSDETLEALDNLCAASAWQCSRGEYIRWLIARETKS